MSDFVTPRPHRLTLHDGEFVDIQAELNHGDSEDLNARLWPSGGFDRRMVRTARICAYLLGWSLTKDGEPVPYSPEMDEQTRLDTIRGLSQARAVEIFDAIDAYETTMKREREEKKRTLRGAPAADATSPSPSAPAGESNGSARSAETTTTTSSP